MVRAALVLALVACRSAAPAPAPAPPPAAPPPVPSPVALSGIWLGTLHTGGAGLRIQVHLDLAPATPSCELDSLEQHAMGIPCDHVVVSGKHLAFAVPAVQGSLEGTVSADGNTIHALWTQGGTEFPLMLARQAAPVEEAKAALDPAMDAVDIDKLQAVLDADFATLLAGQLAPATGVGVTIGVLAHGQRAVFSYGAVKPDSVFEIGSITKTFTGLALAQMVQQKQVRFDEPVRALLPTGTVAAPASGAEITLVDLSAQRSGFPRMPDNFKPANPADPYADYDAKALYAFVAAHGVALPATPAFGYSNVGVGLLGQALAVRAGTSYEALVTKEITRPLGMHDTVVDLTPALTKRAAPGHGAGNKPEAAWHLNALAGAGAIRSTAADMLIYLDAQLHPEHVKGTTREARTLAAALTASHEVRGEAEAGMHIALNWFRIDATGLYWHDGATGGFSSFALFYPDKDLALVVLVNRSVDDGPLADQIGQHVAERLLGRPATTVGP